MAQPTLVEKIVGGFGKYTPAVGPDQVVFYDANGDIAELAALQRVTFNEVTSNLYELVTSDAGKLVTMTSVDATAYELTIPETGVNDPDFVTGDVVTVFNEDPQDLSILVAGATTLRGRTILAQYETTVLVKDAAGNWIAT